MRSDDSSTVIAKAFNLLLVEDNPGDVRLVHEVFHQSRKTAIFVTGSTAQACDFLNQKGVFCHAPMPDLILLDLNLPVLSGHVFLRLRSRIAAWREIPLVVYTSSAQEIDRQTCLTLGADDYIVKPRIWIDWTLILQTLVDQYSSRKR